MLAGLVLKPSGPNISLLTNSTLKLDQKGPKGEPCLALQESCASPGLSLVNTPRYDEVKLINRSLPCRVAEAGPLRRRPQGRSNGRHEVLHRDDGVEGGDEREIEQGVPGQEADPAPAGGIGDPGGQHEGPDNDDDMMMTR